MPAPLATDQGQRFIQRVDPGIVSPDLWRQPPRVPEATILPEARPYRSTEDFRDITRQERERGAAFEDMMERDFETYGQPFLGHEDKYRRLADQAYEPLLRGGAGYSPEEQEQITREGELRDLQMTPEERAEIGMTPEEQQGIIGDPDRALDYYNPKLLYGMAESGAARQREAIGESAPTLRSAATSSGLYQDPNYAGRTLGRVGQLEESIGEAIDPSRLRVSEEFQQNYPLSDKEVDATAELASRGASTRYAADLDRYRQRAAESGMAAPFAEAALTSRLRRRGAIAGADASTSARLAATAQQREQMRQAEQMRMSGETGLAGARLRSSFGLAGLGTGVERDIEYGRVSGERDVASRRAGAERDVLGARLQSEQDIGRRAQRTGEFTQALGTGLAGEAERQRAARERDRFGLRQEASKYRQGQRFGRGQAASDRLSDRHRDVAQERLGGEREGRGYLTGQQQQAGDRYEDFASRRIPAFRAGTERTQGAMRARLGQRNAPGGTERLVTNFLGS